MYGNSAEEALQASCTEAHSVANQNKAASPSNKNNTGLMDEHYFPVAT